MNIKDFTASLDYLVKAELTPFIWGHAGIGKSSIVKQYAKEKGYHFFPFYLGTQSDLGDILGLADFVRDKNGTAIATTFAIPDWLRKTINYCENNPESGAVIFLDEFNRARRDILNGMFSLALDKTFHTLKLPKNCHIVAAGNPPTDEYFTTDVDETALMARFVHIKLEPTVDEWVKYAEATEIDHKIVGFIREQPELLEQKHTEFNLPVKVDRRAYERLDRLFRLKTPDELLFQLMLGIIGLERTVAYKKYLEKSDKPLEAVDVLSGKSIDLVIKWADPKNTMASLLNLTCENLEKYIGELDKNKILLTKDEKKHLMTFFNSIPKDIVHALLVNLVNQGNKTLKDFYDDKEYEEQLITLIKTAKGLK